MGSPRRLRRLRFRLLTGSGRPPYRLDNVVEGASQRGSRRFPRMREKLRPPVRQVLAVVGMLSLAGTVLSAAPAQAATKSTAHTTTSHVATAKHPGKGSRAEGPKAPAQAKSSALVRARTGGAADAKAVCAAVKIGYSTCMSILRTNTKHYK